MVISTGVIALIIGMAMWQDGGTGIGDRGELKKFSSASELKAFLQEHQTGYQDAYGIIGTDTAIREGLPASAPVPAIEKWGLNIPVSESASGYSTTNIQVEGVDEPDFVKNDGKYIYIISGDRLLIVDAYPAEKARVLSEITVKGRPAELFLNGDHLVVFSRLQEEYYLTPRSSIVPVPCSREATHAYVYSVRDRSRPELLRDINVSGSYYDARMIGDYVYLITSEYVRWCTGDPVLPYLDDGAGEGVSPDIYYFDIPQRSFMYYTLAALDVRGRREVKAETFLLGYSTTLFASKENIYIAYQKEIPVRRWAEIAPAVRSVEIGDGIPRQGSIIHKFGVNGDRITYIGMGEVPGHLLNQFSMDEYNDHLRVATTVEGWTREGGFLFNNVYVLDREMKTKGRLEYIAPDEKIYSTRFVGDRLYMVTFKRIDPFFVIDLSDPEHPGILGKLKIPGFSDYLHPYDSRHILGIGKETEENQWGGVSIGGLKIALFDVSDVNYPKLVDKVEIGEAGTDSEALRDHKAFLFDCQKDLLVIPVREVRKVPIPSSAQGAYSQKIWLGAYVFGVSPEKGFTLRGTVTHSSDAPPYYYYYWGAPDTVKRALYMDDVLYTISTREIVMTDLKDLSRHLNRLGLPSEIAEPVYPLPLKAME
ncbi:MAG: beta-propeller domain-containing protein [Methanomicrobiales archaeon]|nr:beta-propeller domain-containing protein [Methanomicrobiales archaeon]